MGVRARNVAVSSDLVSNNVSLFLKKREYEIRNVFLMGKADQYVKVMGLSQPGKTSEEVLQNEVEFIKRERKRFDDRKAIYEMVKEHSWSEQYVKSEEVALEVIRFSQGKKPINLKDYELSLLKWNAQSFVHFLMFAGEEPSNLNISDLYLRSVAKAEEMGIISKKDAGSFSKSIKALTPKKIMGGLDYVSDDDVEPLFEMNKNIEALGKKVFDYIMTNGDDDDRVILGTMALSF